MKRFLLIIMAIIAMASTQAQTYLNDQDYVTISAVVPNYWDQTQNKNIDLRVYQRSDGREWIEKILSGSQY